MPREIHPGIHWIQEFGPDRPGIAKSLVEREARWYQPGREIHVPQNAFLFAGKRTLLFDTLSPAGGEQIIADLEKVLGGRPLDYLALSHPDVPHAGNTFRILERYPEATLVAPRFGETHELYHLEAAHKVGPGDSLDLGGKRLHFHHAAFLDAAMSMWMTEENRGMLLPVDWMGLPLMDGEGLLFADEFRSSVDVDRYAEFHGRVMFWLRYVDVARTQREIDMLLETYQPAMVASAHGPVIREDVPRHFEMMKEVVERVATGGRTGVL
jgi:flavorubredoxin